jgi:hypothetical protein
MPRRTVPIRTSALRVHGAREGSRQRPNKLRAERTGDLVNQVFVYDGKSLTLYNPQDKVQVAAPDTLEGMLDFARTKLDIVAPASDLLDADRQPLDGGKNYKLRLPPNIPVKDFWSVIVYDTQTRSMLQTDQRFPSVSSQNKALQVNADGSVDVYFGPKAPSGKESNWVQTIPGKAWFTILRLYGPLEPWFNKTWRPDDIRRVK